MALIKILALIIYKKNGIYIIILLFIRKIYETNFENMHNSLITLFIVTTLENWPGIMYQFLDGGDETSVFI